MAETTLGTGSSGAPRETSAGHQIGTTAGDFPPASSATASFPQELGSVKLLELIGRGASGAVYRGHDTLLNRSVAVKFLAARFSDDAAHRQRFLDEARMVAAVRHPNLVEIHQAGFAGDSPYLVLAFVSGATLAQVIRHAGPLPLEVVIEILDQTSAALQELHRQGIVHRDIKPTNILVDSDGQVRVTDLGVSLRTSGASCANLPAHPVGTPLYMAPEAFEGRASPRSDVYSLGITLFELLTGEPPYSGTFEELVEKHRHEPLPAEPLLKRGISEPVIEVLQRAVHKELPFRFKLTEDFARALRNAAGVNSNSTRIRSELSLLVRQSAGLAPAQSKTPTTADPAGAESVDQIIQLTRERRQDLIARKYPPLNASSSDATPGGEVQPAINGDLPCLTCEYNLRGLPLDGHCPECGSPVTQSVNPDLLRFVGPAFIGKLRLGAGLILYTPILMFLILLVNPWLLGYQRLVQSTVFSSLQTVLPLLGWGFFFVGMYLLTSASPRTVGDDRLQTLRRWTRAAVFIALATFVAAYFGSRVGWNAGWKTQVLYGLGLLGGTALLLALFGHLRCLRQLAKRIPSSYLSRRADLLSWALPSSWALLFTRIFGLPIWIQLPLAKLLSVLTLVSFLAVLGSSLFYLIFIGSFRRRLGKELIFARQIAARQWN